MKPYAFILGALFALSSAHAQESFSKARIIRTDGTSFSCLIRNTAYEGTQQEFIYRLQEGEPTRTLDVKDIRSVEWEEGTVLERHLIQFTQINQAPVNRKKEDYEAAANQQTGFFFLERLLKGAYSFYRLVDRYSYPHFFYSLPADGGLHLLVYREFVDENAIIVNKHEFRNQLVYLATSSGCDKQLAAAIERSEYRLAMLTKIFRQLNGCAGAEVIVNKASGSGKSKIRLALAGGVAATSLTTDPPNSSSYPGLTNDAFSSKLGPLAGFAFELTPPSRLKTYTAGIELLYHSYSAATDSLHPNAYLTSIGRMKFSAFNVMPFVRFRLGKQPVKPFIELGPSARFLMKNADEYIIRNSIAGTTTRLPIFTGQSTTLALMGGAGVELKRVSVHGRYLFPVQKSATYYSNIFVMVKFALTNPE